MLQANDRFRCSSNQPAFKSFPLIGLQILSASDQECTPPSQASGDLSKAPRRQRPAGAKGPSSVQEKEVEVAMVREGLRAVVENDYGDLGRLDQAAGGSLRSVFPVDHQESVGLQARLFFVNAAMQQFSVAARHNQGDFAPFPKETGEPTYKRGLSSAPDLQVPTEMTGTGSTGRGLLRRHMRFNAEPQP